MADAKVIPFDDDRSRGSRGAGSRRRGGPAESAPAGERNI